MPSAPVVEPTSLVVIVCASRCAVESIVAAISFAIFRPVSGFTSGGFLASSIALILAASASVTGVISARGISCGIAFSAVCLASRD